MYRTVHILMNFICHMTDQKHHRFIHRNDRDELGRYLFPRWKRWWWWIDWKAEAGGLLWKTLIEATITILIMILGVVSLFVFIWVCDDTTSGEQIWRFILSDIFLIER